MARNLRREAQARGIGPERLVFAPRWRSRTTLRAIGSPICFSIRCPATRTRLQPTRCGRGCRSLTSIGNTYAGRVCASLLNAIGLPELITDSLEAYEFVALQLASDADALSAIKDKVGRNCGSHPLFDTDRFRRHFEAAFIKMWERHERGELPASFSVEPLD